MLEVNDDCYSMVIITNNKTPKLLRCPNNGGLFTALSGFMLKRQCSSSVKGGACAKWGHFAKNLWMVCFEKVIMICGDLTLLCTSYEKTLLMHNMSLKWFPMLFHALLGISLVLSFVISLFQHLIFADLQYLFFFPKFCVTTSSLHTWVKNYLSLQALKQKNEDILLK